ncbi:hypothetical protein [Chitinilyticum aquatile]|uniref:hypothetical protein n=1 Tax=Chitinilyticum aquatile TaxID=362520 RepID=UPI000404ABDD|nr:hypothetical protein [Chitinilyticum aquatile]
MNCIAATLSAALFGCNLAHARVDPAYLETAAATGGEVIDAPRAVMAAGDVPLSLQRYFEHVEFVRPSNNLLTPHVMEKPIRLLRSGPRKLELLLRDKKQYIPAAVLLLDAQTQAPVAAALPCKVSGKNEVYCEGTITVPKHAFYLAVRYPTPSGEVLRIHGRKFKPVW